MHIAIMGLAGSGKTTAAREVALKNSGIEVASASSLIAGMGGQISYSVLKKAIIDSNQYKLIEAYKEFKHRHAKTILEAHSLIESQHGIVEIPAEVLRALDFDFVYFIKVKGIELKRRRTADSTKSRRIAGAEELEQLQRKSIKTIEKALPGRLRIVDNSSIVAEVSRLLQHDPC